MTSNKVAIFLPCLLTGGTEVATLQTALSIRKLGHEVSIVVYFNEIDQKMLAFFNDEQIQVYLLNLTRKPSFINKLELIFKLTKVIFLGKYQTIWIQYLTPTLLPIALGFLFSKNLIISVHVITNDFSKSAIKRLRWIASNLSGHCICVSHAVAKSIFSDYLENPKLKNKILVFPNTIDVKKVELAAIRDWKSEFTLPKDAFLIGYVGRLNKSKGVETLLHAIKKLKMAYPHIVLIVVGDGSERAPLELLASQLGIANMVIFTGNVSRGEIFGSIKGFDAVVVPSIGFEGFGISALEAMAAGVPLIASRVEALTEIIKDRQTGLLFSPGNDVELAEKIAILIEDSDLRSKLGHAGNTHANKLYDTKVQQTMILNLFKSLNANN